MTFIEKAVENNPNIILYDGRPQGCPYKYGYEEEYDCDGIACIDCWNREMPNTEQKEDEKLATMYASGLIDGKAKGYDKGLNDAWELAKKCWHMEVSKTKEIFGYEYVVDILENLTPQEALAKLKTYEEAQNKIEVGDVVETTDLVDVFNGVVLDFKDSTDDEVVVFNENGCVDVWKVADCKKTDKHIDIQSILDQIKGE